MTTAGLVFMIGSWSAILALLVFCFYRIFTHKG